MQVIPIIIIAAASIAITLFILHRLRRQSNLRVTKSGTIVTRAMLRDYDNIIRLVKESKNNFDLQLPAVLLDQFRERYGRNELYEELYAGCAGKFVEINEKQKI